MRNGFLFSILILSAIASQAQKYKYKELVPMLQDASPREQIGLLWDYIVEDPNVPNADYRLARLHFDIFKKSDPIVDYASAMAHAHESSLRLLRAKMLVTESDVRRENEYYAPLFNTVDSKGRPYVEFSVVQKDIIDSYDSAVKFEQKMPAIYKSFTKSVHQYDQAVKAFAVISNEYKSMEDIFMLYDNDFEARLKHLKSTYDSSLFYFRQYLALTKEYPLKKYKQKYTIKPIQVYRLDGLITRLNFLTSEVEFWNYGAWADDVMKVYREEIMELKDKIAQNETKVTESLRAIEASQSVTTPLYKLDKEVAFKLNNYDRNSLVLALLEYKTFRQEWLLKTKSIGADSLLDKKLELYSNLIQLNRVADSLKMRISRGITPVNLKKHEKFLTRFYDGEKGLENYVRGEDLVIQSSFEQYRDKLKEGLIVYSQPVEDTTRFIKAGGHNIPIFARKKSLAELTAAAPVTLQNTRNPDGSMYLAGIHKMNRKNPNDMVFIVRINPDGKPGWYKEYNFSPDSVSMTFDSYFGGIVATQEGCAAIITSKAAIGSMSNTLVFISDKGEESIHKLNETKMARRLIYQESSNTFTIIFKGTEETQEYLSEEGISLININVLGDLNWRRDVALAGTVQDVVSVRDGYLVVGNFTSIRDDARKELKTRINTGQSNPYVIKLNLRGDVLRTLPVTTAKSIYIDKVVKVNDESINLLGYEKSFIEMAAPSADKGNIKHLLLTYNLKTICSDF